MTIVAALGAGVLFAAMPALHAGRTRAAAALQRQRRARIDVGGPVDQPRGAGGRRDRADAGALRDRRSAASTASCGCSAWTRASSASICSSPASRCRTRATASRTRWCAIYDRLQDALNARGGVRVVGHRLSRAVSRRQRQRQLRRRGLHAAGRRRAAVRQPRNGLGRLLRVDGHDARVGPAVHRTPTGRTRRASSSSRAPSRSSYWKDGDALGRRVKFEADREISLAHGRRHRQRRPPARPEERADADHVHSLHAVSAAVHEHLGAQPAPDATAHAALRAAMASVDPEIPPGRHPHARPDHRLPDRRAALSIVRDRVIRNRHARARRGRAVRVDQLQRRATDARDRHPRRARRSAWPGRRADAASRV